MNFDTITYEVESNVARLTMNRPAVRNSLNAQMAFEMLQAVQTAAADSEVRAILLTGAGSAFCSGADLGSVNTDPDPALRAEQSTAALKFVHDFVNPLMSALYQLDKPLVTAVNGATVGGGIGLALVADVVIAAECARFIPKFTPQLALIPDLGSTWMWPRLIGRARSLGLSLLGDTLNARQAEEWGLIWRCCPDEDLHATAWEIAQRLARGPALATACAKRALRASQRNDFEQQLQLEMELSAQCCGSEDFCEGVAAFLSKRTPDFVAVSRKRSLP